MHPRRHREQPWDPRDLEPGEAESEECAAELGPAYTGLAQSYRCVAPPGHGAEVFSLIRRSPLEPGDYLDRFFDTGDERSGSVDPG